MAHSANAPAHENARALAGMLLAAAIAALLVVAYQLINACTDGHLLAGWVTLWTLVFGALAVLAPQLRQLAGRAAALILQQLHPLHPLHSLHLRHAPGRAPQRVRDQSGHDSRLLADLPAIQTIQARTGDVV